MRKRFLLFWFMFFITGCEGVSNYVVVRLHVETLTLAGLGGSIIGMFLAYVIESIKIWRKNNDKKSF